MIENKTAKTPADGPVAWMHTTGTGHVYFRKKPQDKVFNPQPVFTAAPKAAEWVGLTDEEVSEIIDREIGFNSCWGPEEKFARAIEQALKEKNT